MSSDDVEDDDHAPIVQVHTEALTPTENLAKAEDSTQLEERRIRARAGLGLRPPYNPDRLAAFLELNETHAAAVRKKARYEVGFGFDIVPHEDVDPDDASDDERETVREFWRGSESTWQTGPHQSAEPTTPEEVLELARQDYHAIGWACIEILANNAGEPVGLAHVPANTVRVRKPPTPDEDDEIDDSHERPREELAARGYVQTRRGRRRYFGEAGDRYQDTPVFVDRENGDVVEGSAEQLTNQPANELIFVRNPSPLTLHYGIPDWISSLRTITADEAAKDYNRAFFDNDTIPRMVIKVTGGELSEESKRDLRQMMHGLREESHRGVVLEVEKYLEDFEGEADIEIEPVSQGISEEMSFEAFRDKNEHDIAKAHDLPPILIGVTETSNRSNSQEQVADFANNVIAPEQHKFAERLYQVLHQTAMGVVDWTIEFELKGAEQPKKDAEIARRKIQAVNGAIPIDRALEMIGEDPLPDDHPVDGQTLVADVGSDTQPVGGGQSGGEGQEQTQSRADHAPPPENKIGERDWDAVEADLTTKEPIEQTQFNSSNLDEGLYDFGADELYLSFKREDGQSSLYVYVDVPTAEWQMLTTASSAGSYHWDNIRLEFPYVEVTNFHDRLPEGPAPSEDEIPDDIPTDI